MDRLPVTDWPLGIALHTIGYPLRTKVWRDELGSPARLSGWIDHKVRECAKVITDLESGKLASATPHHPLLAARAGISCLQTLEAWLRDPDNPPRAWSMLKAGGANLPVSPLSFPFPLRTTADLCNAAALIAFGFVPRGTPPLHNAGDGTHAALPLLVQSRTQAGLTRALAYTILARAHDPLCTQPLAYAAAAATNWINFNLKRDPSAAKEFTALLRGVGTRAAVVSRKLLETTARYIEVKMPGGITRRIKNRFRDQMRHHLQGFAASEIT